MAKCYWTTGVGNFLIEDQQLCGPSIAGAQVCCYPGDTCLENSICHYTHPLVGGSGYYIGACTDPNLPEPCSKSCTDWRTPDIVYTDASTSLWACCYQSLDAALDCSNPGNDTFYAPAPEALTTQAKSHPTTSSPATSSINSSITLSSTPSSSVTTPTSTTTSKSTSTPTPSTSFPTLPTSIPPSSATTTHPPPSAPSTGTKAGIGIAASIAGLGITLMLGFYLFRKRRPRRYRETPPISASNEVASSLSSSPPMLEPTHVAVEKGSDQRWELDGNGRSELDGRGRSELEARR